MKVKILILPFKQANLLRNGALYKTTLAQLWFYLAEVFVHFSVPNIVLVPFEVKRANSGRTSLLCRSIRKGYMDITIYRTQTESLIKQKSLQQLLQQLPSSLKLKALRYRSDSSRYNYILGRLLLKRGLDFYGLDNDLEKIEFQKNGKPALPGIHFNISHSDHQIICGFSKEGPIGVDLEKINPIDFDDFVSMFSAQEWTAIRGADDPIRTFYWFWTRKESIIKALGRTLLYLHQIELDVSSDHFLVDGKRYFLRNVDIEEGFVGAVCTEEKIEALEVVDIWF